MGKMNSFVTGVMTGLAAAAIGQELQKPREERTWQGKVAGVPYNFRVQDWGKIAGEYWNPESDQIIVPHVIGLGWGVNFAALVRRVQHLAEPQQQSERHDEAPRLPEPVER